MITDVCVPLTKLPDLIQETKRRIQKTTLPCPILAHAGDGNFHVLIFFKPDDAAEVAAAQKLSSDMAIQAIALGGTCTGEHGIGVGKKAYLRKEMGEGTMQLMQLIKRSVDPRGILNPGKIFDDIAPSASAKK
jgi:D-lactate dehydrogenase (cytochrome)